MQRIQDGRRDIMVHGSASVDELPIDGLSAEQLTVAGTEPFVPANMDDPKIYPGDVIVGVTDGEITFGELIYNDIDEGVLVVDLDTGVVELIPHARFTKRFFQEDEIHVYDDITREAPSWDIEFDESVIERPEISRAR